MVKWGLSGDALCLFRRGALESREHLYFHCRFSPRIWRDMLNSSLIVDPYVEWEDVIKWGIKELRDGGLKSNLCRLTIGAVVYHLWKLRNDLKPGNIPRSEEAIVKTIRWEIQSRIMAKGRFKLSDCEALQKLESSVENFDAG